MQQPDPVRDAQRKISEWLERVKRERNLSLTKLAEIADMSPSSLSRNIKPKADYRYVMSTTSVLKIARATGIAPPAGMVDEGNGYHAIGFDEPEIVPIEQPEELPKLSASATPNLSHWELKTRALELAGFMPGDIVTLDQARTARSGDIVCATIASRRGSGETVFRRLEGRADDGFLVTETMDPVLRTKRDYVDNDRVVIMGKVIRLQRLLD